MAYRAHPLAATSDAPGTFLQVFISGCFISSVSQMPIPQGLVCGFFPMLNLGGLRFRACETEDGCHFIRKEYGWKFGWSREINFLARIDKTVAPPVRAKPKFSGASLAGVISILPRRSNRQEAGRRLRVLEPRFSLRSSAANRIGAEQFSYRNLRQTCASVLSHNDRDFVMVVSQESEDSCLRVGQC